MIEKEKLDELFRLFCDSNSRRNLDKPFKQHGVFAATNQHALIQIPCDVIDMGYAEIEKPNIGHFYKPDRTNWFKLDVSFVRKAVIDANETVEIIHDCTECDGEGEISCDCCGNEYDCKTCRGSGGIPTGKMEPDPNTYFDLGQCRFRRVVLQLLLDACDAFGVNEVDALIGTEMQRAYFKVGAATVLLMPCYKTADNVAHVVPLPN